MDREKKFEKLIKENKKIRGIWLLIGAIAASVKVIAETFFGLNIPSEAVDSIVNGLLAIVIIAAAWYNNYAGEKGTSQLNLLKQSNLD